MDIKEIVMEKLFNCLEALAEDGVKELVEDGVLTEQADIEEAKDLMEDMVQYILDGEWDI